MTIFDINTNVKHENKIVYNYPKVTLIKSEITATPTALNMTFFNGSANPNFIYTVDGASTVYNHKKSYFSRLIHNNISTITDGKDSEYGELVIEHEQVSSSNKKIYVCFLLKYTADSAENDIDKMISFNAYTDQQSTIIDLNKSLDPLESCIVYESGSPAASIVFVSTTPISINQSSSDKVRTLSVISSLFTKSPTKSYVVVPKSNVALPNEDEIYIDCNPTGESAETVVGYNVPVISDEGDKQDAIAAMRTMYLFGVFAMVSILIVMFVPGLYHLTVLSYAMKATVDTGAKKVNSRTIGNMRVLDLLLSFVLLLIGGSLLLTGMLGEDSSYATTSIGFMILFITFESILLINIKKSDASFMKYNKIDITYKDKDPERDDIKNFQLGKVVNGVFKAFFYFITWIYNWLWSDSKGKAEDFIKDDVSAGPTPA